MLIQFQLSQVQECTKFQRAYLLLPILLLQGAEAAVVLLQVVEVQEDFV
jgi:hypothetical protein